MHSLKIVDGMACCPVSGEAGFSPYPHAAFRREMRAWWLGFLFDLFAQYWLGTVIKDWND